VSDRAWAKLIIGGKAKRSVLDAILRKHTGEGLDEAEKNSPDDDRGYPAWDDDHQHVVVTDSEASGAMFEGLENALVEAEIDFDRQSAACIGAWGDTLAVYRRGMKAVIEHESNESSEDWLMPVKAVRELLKKGAGPLRDWLDQRYPVVPELTPIEWVPE
jgi:hypothetical protein